MHVCDASDMYTCMHMHVSDTRKPGDAGAGEMILLTVPHKEPSRSPPAHAPPTPSAPPPPPPHPLAQFLDETRGKARRPRLQMESGRACNSANAASQPPRPAPPAPSAHPCLPLAEEELPPAAAPAPEMLLIGTHADRAGVAGTHAATRSGSRCLRRAVPTETGRLAAAGLRLQRKGGGAAGCRFVELSACDAEGVRSALDVLVGDLYWRSIERESAAVGLQVPCLSLGQPTP